MTIMMMMQSASISLLKTETFCLFARFDDCSIQKRPPSSRGERFGTQRRLWFFDDEHVRQTTGAVVVVSGCPSLLLFVQQQLQTMTTPSSPVPQVYQKQALLYEQTKRFSYCSKNTIYCAEAVRHLVCRSA
jgi:hypothetical protein